MSEMIDDGDRYIVCKHGIGMACEECLEALESKKEIKMSDFCAHNHHKENCVLCMSHKISALEKKVEVARVAFTEITKGVGAFSNDPLEHASNTIEDMKELAKEALEAMDKP